MQCASCRFENMPSVLHCGRCGGPLGISAMAIDVAPPRASPWQKRLRRVFPWHHAAINLREEFRTLGRTIHAKSGADELPLPPWQVSVRLIAPGWPFFYLDEVMVGRVILAAYFALIFLALLFMGTFVGNITLGLAASLHASSALSILFRYAGHSLGRVSLGLLLLLGLNLLVYAPALWLFTRVVMPLAIQAGSGPLAEGDVVACNQTAFLFSLPRPGQIVMAGGPTFQIPGRGGAAHATEYYEVRMRIDRILASPGDSAVWDHGTLFVNNAESTWKPLNPEVLPNHLEVTVPSGCYLIFPTALPRMNGAALNVAWASVGVVPQRAIQCTVYWRTYPIWRFGPVS